MAVALLGFVAIASTACAEPPSPEPAAQTWIAVYGPIDWSPPDRMSLEVAGTAWSLTPDGGGGVVTESLTSPAEVRLVGLDDCRLYARFDATPGSAHIIRFAPDGSVQVQDNTGGIMELGPGLVERAPSDC
jgi:hypothetical protein